MVQRLPRFSPKILVLAALLVAARDGDAQQSVPKATAPAVEAPRSSPASPSVDAHLKELEKQLAAAIEKSFGKNSAEARQPVRFWLSRIGMGVAAKEATLRSDGRSVRFVDVSLGLPAEGKILHGAEGVIVVDWPIVELGQLSERTVVSVELQSENGVVTLKPLAVNGSFTGTSATPVRANRFDKRFKFKLDSQAPLADFLPSAPELSSKMPLPFNEDLTNVAEIGFGEPMAKNTGKHQAMEATAHAIAKINHLNAKQHDGFMLAMIEHRADLRGLPILMGNDCRSGEKQAQTFASFAKTVHQRPPHIPLDGLFPNAVVSGSEMGQLAAVAALSQILMPEPEQARISLAKYLAMIPHIDATKALARLAIFSAEDTVRAAAVEGLKLRRERDYTDVLMQGFNYPLPVVARRSAEALVKLDRKDVLADLVDVLERPDPRLPVAEKQGGKDVVTVRELVKVNHHRNCLLCHAPGNSENIPAVVLKVAVPSQVEPLPKSTDGGYRTTPSTPDILVRIDMTYLRQDFSLMMPVADAHPWPEMQRFDFLVRTRSVTLTEAQAYEARREADEPGRPSVYHRAALFALRELSGRDAEATPQAWRKVLNIAKRS